MDLRIVIIGAGRLGSSLALGLWQHGMNIVQIVSRSISSAYEVSERIGRVDFTADLEQLNVEADLYFICVADKSIEAVARQVEDRIPDYAILLHCSGATSLSFSSFQNRAVAWPVYSFGAKHLQLDWSSIPICHQSSNEYVSHRVKDILNRLTNSAFELSDEQRLRLHMSAAMGANFSTALYAMIFDVCAANDLPFHHLIPILKQSSEKLASQDPFYSISGPAVRGDVETQNRHLNALPESMKPIYQMISKWISAKKIEQE